MVIRVGQIEDLGTWTKLDIKEGHVRMKAKGSKSNESCMPGINTTINIIDYTHILTNKSRPVEVLYKGAPDGFSLIGQQYKDTLRAMGSPLMACAHLQAGNQSQTKGTLPIPRRHQLSALLVARARRGRSVRPPPP